MIRALILFVVLSGSQQAQAAVGFTFDFVYLCRATAITEKSVNVCSRKIPQLAERGKTALAGWKKRNAKDAQRGVEMCEAEIKRQHFTDEQQMEAEDQMERLEVDYFNAMETNLDTKGGSECFDFLSRTERSEHDLSHVFPQ